MESKGGKEVAEMAKVPTLTPPVSFICCEERIYRCFAPLLKHHLTYLKTVYDSVITTIINVSGDQLYVKSTNDHFYYDDENIKVYNLYSNVEDPPNNCDVSSMEQWVKYALDIIIAKSVDSSILIVGNDEACYDCLIIACLRKLQSWSIVSIINELRFHIGSQRKIFDLEQFIELFNPEILSLPSKLPSYLELHENLLSDEIKLCDRIKTNQSNTDDGLLHRLLFSSNLMLISPGSLFDATVSLVNDKDDED
jgi:hypothetical protein